MLHSQIESENKKIYNLEERTFYFAKNIRAFVKKIEANVWNKEDVKQLVRSSGSVAANYIEANEKLGEKDFLMKIRICKKETKESILWLKLLDIENTTANQLRLELIKEAQEIQNIFGAIYKKALNNQTK